MGKHFPDSPNLLNFSLVQSGPFWVLKSITAKKLHRCYKAPKIRMYDPQMFVTRKVTRYASDSR